MKAVSKGHTILLVDDESDILEFLSYNLSKEGYKVYTASNGEDGVKAVKQYNPSLVILDIMMPIMDGIETCQIIRKDTQIIQPIIAFLTSRSEDYSQVAGFEAGADDYITKPVRPRLLVSKVESLLRRLTRSFETPTLTTSNLKINRDKFIVEIKAVEALNEVHLAQLLTYLKLTNCKLGLLINFNVKLLKNGVQRVINGIL